MSKRLQELYSKIRNQSIKTSIFTDLDLTTCNIHNPKYAKENGDGCCMQPQIRKAFATLRSNGTELYIVTGRHWEGTRLDDLTGKKINDGALYDLLGGEKSEFRNCKAVAGHGRTLTKNGKTTVLGRTKGKELEEQKFAVYVGKKVLTFKKMLFKKYPDMRGLIGADFKKHLSFVDVKPYTDKLTDEASVEEIKNFVRKHLKFIVEGKNDQGKPDLNAPKNPNNIFKFIEEPTGVMEIRPTNWSKRKGIEASGFLEEAFNRGGAVIVMGDSLGKNGTDRDLFEAANEFFNKKNARERLFLIQVVNNENDGVDKQIYDDNDSCKPDIAVKSPDYLGAMLSRITNNIRRENKNISSKNIKNLNQR